MAWIEKCFSEWHGAQGKNVTMDKIMGLKPGSGKDPAYKAALLDDRNAMLFYDMARLIRLGARIAEAAEMVSRKLEGSKGWNKSKWHLSTANSDSLAQAFTR